MTETPVEASPFSLTALSRAMTTAGIPLIFAGIVYLCSHVIAGDQRLTSLEEDRTRTTATLASITNDLRTLELSLSSQRYTPADAKADLGALDVKIDQQGSRLDKLELGQQHNADAIESLRPKR